MRTSRAAATITAPILALVLASFSPRPSTAADTQGPRVVDVSVRGAESVPDRLVRSILVPDASAPFDPDALPVRADSLLSVLAARGRPFAKASIAWSDSAGGVQLDVLLEEGRQARLDTLVIARATAAAFEPGAMPERAQGLGSGSVLDAAGVEAEIAGVLDSYRAAGRPLAVVSPGEVVDGADGLALTLVVDEGPLVRFGDLAVRGNTVTKHHVIERETGIARGDVYDGRRVERIRPKLEKLGIFESVEDPVVAFDASAGLAIVGLEVAEGPASSVSGVLGYDASDVEGGGEVTGLVDVALGNIAGTGRQASASWERLRAGHTTAAFSYTEPWLLGAPLDIGVRGAQSVRDTLYTTTEADLLVTTRMGERTRVTWSVGGERYVPGSATEHTTTSARTALGADFDGTDAPANPTHGVRLAGTVEYAAKEEEDTGRSERSGTVRLLGEAFLPVRARQVVALAARLGLVTSTEEDVPFHEQLTLGGATSLRGYREEQFRGTRTALATLEYRFLLTRRSRALAFLDAGYYYRGGSNYAKDVKLGYGIGLRAETRLGIIALDYGLGEGDSLLDGKLHVGLSREF